MSNSLSIADWLKRGEKREERERRGERKRRVEIHLKEAQRWGDLR